MSFLRNERHHTTPKISRRRYPRPAERTGRQKLQSQNQITATLSHLRFRIQSFPGVPFRVPQGSMACESRIGRHTEQLPSKSESTHPLLITTFTAGFTVFVFVSKSHPLVLGSLMSSSTASIFSFGRCPLQCQHRGLEIQCNRILIRTDLTAPTFLLRRLLGEWYDYWPQTVEVPSSCFMGAPECVRGC